MDSILRKQLVSLYLHLCAVFPTCYIQDIFLVSGHETFWGFFSGFFCCLFLLLSYIALSLCYIGDLCYQILDPVLNASYLKLKVWLSPAIVYSLYVVNVTVHMNLSCIVKCPHCRQPHGTVWTFFQPSQQCLGKIGGSTQKLGIQWEIGYAYTIYTER